MSTLIVLLYILFVAAAIILTVVILLQEGKGGGFGDALGAAGQQAFGVKASGVQRFTMWVALAFLGSAVLIHILNNKRQSQPDIEGGGWDCTIRWGDFGPAKKEVADAVEGGGRTEYNIEIDFAGMIKTCGIVNEAGTVIKSWGMTNSVETLRWLSPDDVERRREDRDDFNAPR